LRCGGRGGARKLLPAFGGGSGTAERPSGNGGRKLFPPVADGELGGSAPGACERFGGGGALLCGDDAVGLEPLGAGTFDATGGIFEGVGLTLGDGSAGGSLSLGGRDGGIVERPPSGRGGLAFFWLFGSSAMLFCRQVRENTGRKPA
jgi:hypothetical protein